MHVLMRYSFPFYLNLLDRVGNRLRLRHLVVCRSLAFTLVTDRNSRYNFILKSPNKTFLNIQFHQEELNEVSVQNTGKPYP